MTEGQGVHDIPGKSKLHSITLEFNILGHGTYFPGFLGIALRHIYGDSAIFLALANLEYQYIPVSRRAT